MTRARVVARDVLVRVDQGAWANRLLPVVLGRSGLDVRDKAFVTEVVYGTVRMQRACDWLLAPRAKGWRRLDDPVRACLRMGAYQLGFLSTPSHAAVSETVSAAPPRARGFVNAVLRRLAADLPVAWPDDATRLSYPDWIVDRLSVDLGAERARDALVALNDPPRPAVRPDGYVQDRASQWVAAHAGVRRGDRVLDVCAAPGGKATALAATGAHVIAADVRATGIRRIRENTKDMPVVQADGRRPPHPPGTFDTVLVDAPCSGLGVLHRRPDARWRVQPEDIGGLAALQRDLLAAAVPMLKPGGELVYSVCTLTAAETVEIDDWLAREYPTHEALPRPEPPWEPAGRGALLLPQTAGTDGMFVVRLRAPLRSP
jgi:16S rRNA (cytosine967-C5)-methyltransferase